MQTHEIKEGATYFCTDQKFRTVRKLSGRKVTWIVDESANGAITSGECGLGRFAALCVREELEG